MKFVISFLISIFLLLASLPGYSQQKIFNRVLSLGPGTIRCITQDKEGYMWLGNSTATGGLYKYDGSKTQPYFHNPKDSNSLGNNLMRALYTDSSGIIWIGTFGGGLDRFDPSDETFIHYRHNPNDPGSLSNDTVLCLLEDHAGRLWVGTTNGLNLLDRNTGKFTRYASNSETYSYQKDYQAYFIYEDRRQNLWIATWGNGLDLFNPETGKFTSYKHRPNDLNSISSDTISTIFEDSKGNFWVGAINNQLQSLDRKTGIFTHYPNYDPDQPGQISGPPFYQDYLSIIRFIYEDAAGALWIGSSGGGINKYDPSTQRTTHYGAYTKTSLTNATIITDSTSGLSDNPSSLYSFFQARDGLLWIGVSSIGNLYNVNPFKKPIPYHRINTTAVNSFYEDKNGALWIGTQEGLIYKPVNGQEKKFVHDPTDLNSLSSSIVNCIRADKEGNLWIATYGGGVDKLNPSTHTFTHYLYNKNGTSGYDYSTFLYIDENNSLWVTTDSGLNKINMITGAFTVYQHNPSDSNSISSDTVYVLAEEKNNLWVGAAKGLNKLDKTTGKWRRYLSSYLITGLFIDTDNVLWAGANYGLFRYDRSKDTFRLYTDPDAGISVRGNVLNIIGDTHNNLWVSFAFRICRINADRDSIRIYGSEYGVHDNQLLLSDNFMSKDGKLFLADDRGYYTFYPEEINVHFPAPSFFISGFRMGNKEVKPGKGSPIDVDISRAKEIRLASDQNSFSLQFKTLTYNTTEKISYRYKLENYDSTWVDLDTQDKAYFFNVPPGHYIFRVRAVSSNGSWSEKTIAIIIKLPWWRTWWGILLQAAGLIGLVSLVSYLRSRQLRHRNKLLEEKVTLRTGELEQSYKNVEQLGQIGRKITSSLSVENILATAYKNVNSLMDASVFGIGIYNPQTEMLDFPATYENGEALPFYSNSVHDENRFGAVCFNSSKEIVMSNLNEQYRDFIQHLHNPHEGQQPASLIYLPLTIKEKKLGVITVQSFTKNAYSDVHLYMLRNIANYTTIALENAESFTKLNQSLKNLRSTQSQLVQSEKMASLGELTAGIAHEIQNPLNFVNNFSEVNTELIDEMKNELLSDNKSEAISIADTIKENEQKISYHGKRADGIVKGMLQHSRSGAGQKEPTDINVLADEYLRLSYHGLRAKNKSFNASMQTSFDETIGKINLVPQDMGRVLLNLFNNAFYAVVEKKKENGEDYKPTVSVITKKMGNRIEISVRDNGNGIPPKILDKIFQPFFTTKPTGQGTGLGLSLSYDVIKTHGGTLDVDTKEGEYTQFTISLPV